MGKITKQKLSGGLVAKVLAMQPENILKFQYIDKKGNKRGKVIACLDDYLEAD